jgi:hypothetical protein
VLPLVCHRWWQLVNSRELLTDVELWVSFRKEEAMELDCLGSCSYFTCGYASGVHRDTDR